MLDGRRLVALCTSRIYEPLTHGFIERFNENIKNEGCSLLVFAINSDIYWEEDRLATEKYVFDLIPYKFIDAIVIMDEKIKSHKIAGKIISKASDFDIPVVVADGHYEGCSCISYDYDKGFEEVVRHMVEFHKVRRPHMMAGHRDNEFSIRRINIFRKVVEENGISFDDSMVSYGDFWADPCRAAMRRLIDRGDLPDAVICANDIMAITVTEMLIREGYKVPGDVLVSGFDGYDGIYFTQPKITTASCDVPDMADAAADLVLDAISGRTVKDRKIAPVFHANQSCGCPEFSEYPSVLHNRFKESFARLNDDNRVLQLMTSSMQASLTPEELAMNLRSYKTGNSMVVIDRKCLLEDENYFTEENTDASVQFVPLYDADKSCSSDHDCFIIPEEDEKSDEDVLAPSVRERIKELMESGYPLIFNSLDFMSKPFGFICFYLKDYLISNYTNTMSVTNAVCTGIGGFVNMRYQRTLLRKMDRMYRHDALTGLYNRIGFQNRLNGILNDPKYINKPVTVMMSDLDGLKSINDNFGHAEGDNAIQKVAEALNNSVPPSSLSTRFGGDEIFSIVIGECDPEKIMRDIDIYLSNYNKESGKPYKVSSSNGYTLAVLDGSFDLTRVIKEADEQMYIQKHKRKNKRI